MSFLRRFVALTCTLTAVTAGFADSTSSPSLRAPALQLKDGLYAEISTPHGAVWCELFVTDALLTVTSFVGLAEGTLGPAPGKPFFDGLTFHRVVPDFVVQGGDPTATGEGGPGYTFADEFAAGRTHDAVGVLSMANDGPDTNGSQFFLTLRPVKRLDYLHTVFGQAVRGLEVLPKIKQGDLFSVRIHRIGEQARAFKADAATFSLQQAKARTFAQVKGSQAQPGPQAHFHDPDGLLPLEPPRAKAFNFKLANVERGTGRRIVGRLFRRSPTAEEDAVAGQFMRNLARQHGTEKDGAVFAYFADEDDWRVWIGDEAVPAFFGRAATSADLGDGAAFHDTKEAFLKHVRTRAAEDLARQQATATKERPLPPGQPLKLQTDAMIDGLIERLRRP